MLPCGAKDSGSQANPTFFALHMKEKSIKGKMFSKSGEFFLLLLKF
jgi:hypothetical protein